MNDRPTVSQRVYLVISFWPCSPSLASASSWGMTTVSSCMMIDAVMYGMMPSANRATRASAPAEKRTFVRRSGIFQALTSDCQSLLFTAAIPPRRSEELGFAAGRLDLVHGAARVHRHAHVEGLVEVAAAEDLDGRARVLHDALGHEGLGRDLVARRERLRQAADVDRHRIGTERADRHALLHVRAAQLAEPHVERRLPALVARAHAAAGAGVVALVPLARGFALAAALAATETLGVLRGARVGAQIVES